MTPSERDRIEERMKAVLTMRMEGSKQQGTDPGKRQVLVCGGTGCTASGSTELLEAFREAVQKEGLSDRVSVVQTGCHGLCALGPVVLVYPEGVFYARVTKEEVEEIVTKHLKEGRVAEELLYEKTRTEHGILSLRETAFYKKQHRVVLRNCGLIDPENMEEYIGTGGYQALALTLFSYTPDQIIEILNQSGLRGRGGAGFPTGRKWSFAKANAAAQKYVCCNADEGDPGAFMDRSLLEGDPHAVLEAMIIAGHTIGANQGYIYVRAEYPIAVKRLEIAIAQARQYGLLGEHIMGSDFSFQIELRLGAGAFVCGEETALMTSIEGNRGEPRPRPPFPAVKGLYESPTILNNVETYANIPQIICKGAAWFRSLGTEKSPGTKVFALGGKIENTGLVEVPMGTSLREVVEEIGGGIPNGKHFKAAQTGGPSGGCIPASHYDVPLDYESLQEIGSMMGSGGLIVMDEDTCMVDIARFFLEFTVDESCGKCTPCRIGTKRMLSILKKITSGKGTKADLNILMELCAHVKESSLCALGQTAPGPVLSTLRYFREEYEAHVQERHCPAGVCKELITYCIDPDICRGCTLCARNCPVGAIAGEKGKPHHIDNEKCVRCNTCMENCHFGAVIKE